MKQLSLAFFVFATISLPVAAQQPVTSERPAANPVVVSGCLIRADQGGFIVIELARPPALPPTPVGTSGRTSTVVYWFDDDAMELFDLAGRRVEMSGWLEREIDRDAVEITSTIPWIQLAFRSDGKDVKVRLPRVSQFARGVDGDDTAASVDVTVQRFRRDTIRLMALSCTP
jgi:hypothetical protein